jgi:hypothetical protein
VYIRTVVPEAELDQARDVLRVTINAPDGRSFTADVGKGGTIRTLKTWLSTEAGQRVVLFIAGTETPLKNGTLLGTLAREAGGDQQLAANSGGAVVGVIVSPPPAAVAAAVAELNEAKAAGLITDAEHAAAMKQVLAKNSVGVVPPPGYVANPAVVQPSAAGVAKAPLQVQPVVVGGGATSTGVTAPAPPPGAGLVLFMLPLPALPTFRFQHPFDCNGILYFIGTREGTSDYVNPQRLGAVVTDCRPKGHSYAPHLFVAHQATRSDSNFTENTKGGWMQLTLPSGWMLEVNHYCLRQDSRDGSGGKQNQWLGNTLRTWALQVRTQFTPSTHSPPRLTRTAPPPHHHHHACRHRTMVVNGRR